MPLTRRQVRAIGHGRRHRDAEQAFAFQEHVGSIIGLPVHADVPTTRGLLTGEGRHYGYCCRSAAGPTAVDYEMGLEEPCERCGRLIRESFRLRRAR